MSLQYTYFYRDCVYICGIGTSKVKIREEIRERIPTNFVGNNNILLHIFNFIVNNYMIMFFRILLKEAGINISFILFVYDGNNWMLSLKSQTYKKQATLGNKFI